jgi:hypothetical protein
MNPDERRRLLHELASGAAFKEARAAGFKMEFMSLEKIS